MGEKIVKISKQITDGSEIEITLKIKKAAEKSQVSYEDIEKDVQDALSSLLLSLICEIGGNKLTD